MADEKLSSPDWKRFGLDAQQPVLLPSSENKYGSDHLDSDSEENELFQEEQVRTVLLKLIPFTLNVVCCWWYKRWPITL